MKITLRIALLTLEMRPNKLRKGESHLLMDKFFGLSENKTNIKTEVIAGTTTFITMAYIIFVNPLILTAPLYITGNPDADKIKTAVFGATCIAAAIGTLMMGLYAKIPFAQAPGMGLNAFFAYTIILGMGYTFQQALAAVFISGLFFIAISYFELREKIVKALPQNINRAITPGIGLFIALIGMVNANLIIQNDATLVQLIDFSKYSSTEVYNSAVNLTYGMAVKNSTVALIGLTITGALMMLKIRGAILIGIIFSTVIGIPFGVTKISEFQPALSIPDMSPTFMQMDFRGLLGLGSENFFGVMFKTITVIIACTLVDMFDTLGTLLGTSRKAGFLNEAGTFPRMKQALMADAIATSVGACLGTSTVTTYVESAAGIAEGGKTGLTSVVTGILFIAALFLAPLLAIVPSAATAPALIIVGVLMMATIKDIDFSEMSEALPAFLTIVMMPFSYSIATGIAAGLITYPILKTIKGEGRTVHPIIFILAVLFLIRFAVVPH